jgi:phosphatidylglycerophosphatase A
MIKKLFITMFGLGYFKYFPGSLASFITCVIFYILWSTIGIKDLFFPYIVFLIIITIYSIKLINNIYKDNDAKEIVIDEFIGQNIPLLAMYNIEIKAKILQTSFSGLSTEVWIISSFVLFRFFDILKPFPINWIDKNIKNGLGVILDDIIAGMFSAITIYIFLLWI